MGIVYDIVHPPIMNKLIALLCRLLLTSGFAVSEFASTQHVTEHA